MESKYQLHLATTRRAPHCRPSFPTRPAKGAVRCRLDACRMGPAIEGSLLSVSQERARIELRRQLRIGAELEIELTGYQCRTGVSIRAVVIHVQPHGTDSWETVCQFGKFLSHQQMADLVR